MNSRNPENTKNINAVLMLEVLGRPKEHLIETLEGIIKKIDNKKGVTVIKKTIKEPVLIKDKKDFYTTFAEVEIEVEEILMLAILLFRYMPSHIEIVNPEIIALSNNGWNDVFNEITRRLHSYDEVARILQSEKKILENKIKVILEDKKKGEDRNLKED